eukprot:1064792_1
MCCDCVACIHSFDLNSVFVAKHDQHLSTMGTPTIIGLSYQLAFSIVFIPLHLYWLSKWRQHNYKTHFVIRHRFPAISIAIFIIATIVQIAAIIYTHFGDDYDGYSEIHPLQETVQALSFLQEGLVFYRVHLVYVRYTMTSEYLTTTMQSHSDTDKIMIAKPKTYKFHVWTSNAILITVIIGTIVTFTSFYTSLRPQYTFGFLILMGIVIAINLCRAKVKEAIGCIQESAWTLFAVFTTLVLSSVSWMFFDNRETRRVFQNSIAHTAHVVVATVVLYVPVRLISKVDSADSPPPGYTLELPNKSPSSSISGIVQPQDHTTDLPNEPRHKKKKHTFLHSFLQDADNYKAFTEYLSRCFALESLLFCERVIILYHVILKYKDLDEDYQTIVDYMKSQHHGEIKDEIAIPMTRLYALKFDYLAGVYEEMEATIQNAMDESGTQAMKYKQGILAIVGLIYKQFCCADSPMQINVCYEVAHALSALFENKEEKEIAAQFDSYEKLCWIFDDALHQTWMMCQDVYAFRFRMYLEMQRAE